MTLYNKLVGVNQFFYWRTQRTFPFPPWSLQPTPIATNFFDRGKEVAALITLVMSTQKWHPRQWKMQIQR